MSKLYTKICVFVGLLATVLLLCHVYITGPLAKDIAELAMWQLNNDAVPDVWISVNTIWAMVAIGFGMLALVLFESDVRTLFKKRRK